MNICILILESTAPPGTSENLFVPNQMCEDCLTQGVR